MSDAAWTAITTMFGTLMTLAGIYITHRVREKSSIERAEEQKRLRDVQTAVVAQTVIASQARTENALSEIKYSVTNGNTPVEIAEKISKALERAEDERAAEDLRILKAQRDAALRRVEELEAERREREARGQRRI